MYSQNVSLNRCSLVHSIYNFYIPVPFARTTVNINLRMTDCINIMFYQLYLTLSRQRFDCTRYSYGDDNDINSYIEILIRNLSF
jgi:hypothetical protein